jgi:hypothetical protein
MNKSKNDSAAARPSSTPPSAPKRAHGVQGGTCEANRLAVVILEVLAGGRTPLEAAGVLGVALPRYYQLEIRALQGLVAALEPRPKVRQPSPEGRIAQLEKALNESRRESARQQALVRAAQRGLGIKPSAATESKPLGKDKAGRRKRRPTVRALKAAKVLMQEARQREEEPLESTDQAVHSAESSPPGNGAPSSGPCILSQGTVG